MTVDSSVSAGWITVPLLVIVSLLLMRRWGVFSAQPWRTAAARTNHLTIWHILMVFLLFMALEGLGGSLLATSKPQAASTWTHWALPIIDTFARLVVVIVILLMAQGRFTDGLRGLGISWRQLPRGALRGLAAYLLIAPALYLTLYVCTSINQLLTHHQPPEHPLLKAMQAHPAAGPLAMLIFMACVSAPISEELFFRGLLQSFIIQQCAAWRRRLAMPYAVDQSTRGQAPPMDDAGEESASPATKNPGPEAPAAISVDPPRPVDRWIAIVVAAGLFALAHYSVAPGDQAWLPGLFLLAVGLGYMYERTGNIWTNITMHALFNGIAVSLVLLVRPTG